jgi:hypothetical protein
MRNLLALFASIAFTSVCFGQLGQSPLADVATVKLVVTTTFGAPVGPVLATLRAGQKEYRQRGDAITFERIPFDLYDLEIEAGGFTKRRERLAIYQTEIRLWFGLFVSRIHSEEYLEIMGSIVPIQKSPRDLWVRLVPLYSSNFVEDRVTPGGEFHLTGFDPGRHVLLVFDKDGLITTKLIDCFSGKQTVNIDLSR